MQPFLQIDEGPSNYFRSYQSTDFINGNFEINKSRDATNSSQQTPKKNIPIKINRSRSCSAGRNKTRSSRIVTRKSIHYIRNV